MRARRLASALALSLALWLAAVPPALAACTAGNPNPDLAESTPTAAFADHGDGTVTHIRTGLMWKRCSQGQIWDGATCTGAAAAHAWQAALAQAAAENFAGRNDWRLPNAKELGSLAEFCGRDPAINQAVFPATPSYLPYFWSGSSYASNPVKAWFVSFGDGGAGAGDKSFAIYVRVVRNGQSFDAFDALAQIPPILGNVPDQAGSVGMAFSLALSAHVTPTNGDPVTGYAIVSGGLPPGLALNTASGDIAGTPSASGSYSVSVTASDKDGASNADAIQFSVGAGASLPGAPVIGTATAASQSISLGFTPAALNGGTLLHYEANCLGALASGSGSPIVLTNLHNGSLYTCKVRAVTNAGAGPWSADSNAVVPSTALPAAPAIGTAIPGNQSISLGFTPGALNGGMLLHYEANCLGALAGGSGSPILLTGLYNGSLYTCKVRAVTDVGAGPWSGSSNAVVPTLSLAEAPVIGTATAASQSISLGFTPGALNGGTLLHYEANCLGALASGSGSPIVLTNLHNGSLYTCKVRAVTNAGAGPWSADSNAVVPTTALPDAPAIGMAVAGNRMLSIGFTPGALNGGTLLYHEANCMGASGTGSVSPLLLAYLFNGSLYTCRVRTVTSVGAGPWSGSSNAVIPNP